MRGARTEHRFEISICLITARRIEGHDESRVTSKIPIRSLFSAAAAVIISTRAWQFTLGKLISYPRLFSRARNEGVHLVNHRGQPKLAVDPLSHRIRLAFFRAASDRFFTLAWSYNKYRPSVSSLSPLINGDKLCSQISQKKEDDTALASTLKSEKKLGTRT